MKPGWKIFLGIFLSLSTMAFVVVYDLYIKDRIDSVEVVVVKAGEEIKKKDLIDRSKVTVERRPKQDLIEGAILKEEMNEIYASSAAQNIVSNSMISKKMIDYDRMIPDESEGEAIRPITGDMIQAQPGSLRRKDSIDIYLVKKGTERANSANVASSADKKLTKEEFVNGPLLKDVRVVYVKDSSNKEVMNGNPEKIKDERLDGSGKISDLEVILNEEDFQKLMDKVVKEGYLLYITYN
ncbi:hypothetical protein ACQKFO_21305 [Rossellomorea sp. NPDC071047]|uniref:hypothetical protein n=1 Tax=Rossellomorea sp. NPDC071047 TaxID=3390675 RepID=UPI003D03EE6D